MKKLLTEPQGIMMPRAVEMLDDAALHVSDARMRTHGRRMVRPCVPYKCDDDCSYATSDE